MSANTERVTDAQNAVVGLESITTVSPTQRPMSPNRRSGIQSVLFDRALWTPENAQQWMTYHGHTGANLADHGRSPNAKFLHYRLQDANRFDQLRTIHLGKGIELRVGFAEPVGEGSDLHGKSSGYRRPRRLDHRPLRGHPLGVYSPRYTNYDTPYGSPVSPRGSPVSPHRLGDERYSAYSQRDSPVMSQDYGYSTAGYPTIPPRVYRAGTPHPLYARDPMMTIGPYPRYSYESVDSPFGSPRSPFGSPRSPFGSPGSPFGSPAMPL